MKLINVEYSNITLNSRRSLEMISEAENSSIEAWPLAQNPGLTLALRAFLMNDYYYYHTPKPRRWGGAGWDFVKTRNPAPKHHPNPAPPRCAA